MVVSYSTKGFPSVDQLINTTVTTPINGEVLTYENQLWVNKVAGAILPPDRICDADGDTCVECEGAPDEDKIRFTTVGVERMIINDSGNVGIGKAPGPGQQLDVNGAFSAAIDQDITCALGNAAIGFTPGLSDFASFSHIDQNTSTNFGFYQYNNGETSVNAAAGQEINLRIANAKKMTIETGGVGIFNDAPSEVLDVTGNIKSSGNISAAADLDVVSYLGNAAIGNGAGWSDHASFCHIDNNNSTDYCLLQNSAGITIINTKAGAPAGMLFGVGGSIKMELSPLGRIGLNSVPSATDYITVGGNIRAKEQLIGAGLQSTLLFGAVSPVPTTTGAGTVLIMPGSNDMAGMIALAGGAWVSGDDVVLTFNTAKLHPYSCQLTYDGVHPGSGQATLYGELSATTLTAFTWTNNTAATLAGPAYLHYLVTELVP